MSTDAYSVPKTHPAVVTVAARAPLEILMVPTPDPNPDELLIHNEWTASTPLDLHQADGGLLVTHPQILGDGVAGTVVRVGASVPAEKFTVGDKVFGFTWRTAREKAHQTYVAAPWYLLGRVPAGASLPAAVTLPNNLVTAFHAITTDLGFTLPWPKPTKWKPPQEHAGKAVLVWGAASSAGMFAVQVLRHWGYGPIIAVASRANHAVLKNLGAEACFDYRDADVADQISAHDDGEGVKFALDCIGSVEGTLKPLARIVTEGARVAILLPVIVKHASESEPPVYDLGVDDALPKGSWAPSVTLRGVRTHYYLNNTFFRDHLQSEIIPALLSAGIIKPNKQRIVEGATLLERAQAAMDALRRREPSGERLVWRVADEELPAAV